MSGTTNEDRIIMAREMTEAFVLSETSNLGKIVSGETDILNRVLVE